MKVKFLQSRKTLALILGVVLLLLLLGALLIPGGSAKYRTQVVQANKVSYDDRLAASFTLTAKGADANGICTFPMLPGTTSTFKPAITIDGKTEIPAYLYLEVTGPDTTLNAGWTKLDGVTGLKGGRVYYYKTVLTNENQTVLTNENQKWTITPEISITWSKIPQAEAESIEVYAYLIQKTGEESAADAFGGAVEQTTP